MDVNAAYQSFVAAHPFYHFLIAAAAGAGLFKMAINKIEAQIPKLTDYVDAYQDKLLDKAGLTDEQKWAIKGHEAKDMRAAADELDKRVADEKAAKAHALASPGPAAAPEASAA